MAALFSLAAESEASLGAGSAGAADSSSHYPAGPAGAPATGEACDTVSIAAGSAATANPGSAASLSAAGPGTGRAPGAMAIPAAVPVGRSSGRRIRGGLMTPWLAASAAVVVLAAMAVRAPAAQLTFPFTPGVRCHGANCSLADRPNHPGKGPAGTDAKPGVHLKQPAPRAPADVDPSNSVPSNAAPVNVTLQYKVISTWSGHHFDAQILVTGQQKLGHWNLTFVIPGVTIQLVLGGAWQHNAANDGGIAYGTPWPWARSSANSARLVVFGIGPARFPASCSFDGRSCIFRPGG